MKKNIKKTIQLMWLMLMLVILALSFCGCAQVRVMTINNEDNAIDEIVTVSLVPEKVVEAGYSVSELKDDIMLKSQAQAQKMREELNQKIMKDLLLVSDQESVDVLSSFQNGIDVIKSDWKDNIFAIGIRFKNIDVYRYYYGIKENVKTEMQTEKHFFYNKVYYFANTMYVKHHELYNKVYNYYSAQYPDLINSETNELLYTYKTDLRRQHSDADYVTRQNGEYYHTWVVDPNNIEEPIMLYYNIANPENWIVVSLLATLGVTIVLLVAGFIVNLRKNTDVNNMESEVEKKDDEV